MRTLVRLSLCAAIVGTIVIGGATVASAHDGNKPLTPSTHAVIAGNTISVTVPAPVTPDPKPNPKSRTLLPQPPTGLTVLNEMTDSVELGWSATDDGNQISHYVVERALNNGLFETAGETSETTFHDSTVTPSTAYTYRVLAVDHEGNASTASLELTVETMALPSPEPVVPLLWDPSGNYKKGDRVCYNGIIYEAVQEHQSHGDPDGIHAISLWKMITPSAGEQ